MRTDFNYEIIKDFGGIGNQDGRCWKRLRLVSWKGAEPKFDIRPWQIATDGSATENPCKGIGLTKPEAQELYTLLGQALTVDQEEAGKK